MSAPRSFHLTRIYFIYILYFCYFVAFTSVLVQSEALYSCHGLEPVYSHLLKVRLTHGPSGGILGLPSLAWMHKHEWIGVDIDTWMIVMCAGGTVLSAFSLVSGCDSAWLLFALWALYSSIQSVGQTFLSFQWDILLIETGAIAILLGRWTIPNFYGLNGFRKKLSARLQQHDDEDAADADSSSSLFSIFLPSPRHNQDSIPLFLLRFLFFRLMFASGVVKITARCPSWTTELSALEYHYATQCLPLPSAWFFHQLPASVQQLSVAICLFIEIPATLLILLPVSVPLFSFLRRLSVLLQVGLQILIMASGNYNFFNYLTIGLAIVSLSDEDWIELDNLIKPWRWCRKSHSHGKHAARTSEQSTKKSSTSELELTATGNAGAAAAKNVTQKTASTYKSSRLSSSKKPSSLNRLLLSTVVLSLKFAALGVIVGVFMMFFSFELDSRIAYSTTTGVINFTGWDALPDLAQVDLRILPYALLQYVWYAFSDYRVRALYSVEQLQAALDKYLGAVLLFASLSGLLTVAWVALCELRAVARKYEQDTQRYRKTIVAKCGARLYWIAASVKRVVRFTFLVAVGTTLFTASFVPLTRSLSSAALHSLPRPLVSTAQQAYEIVQPFHCVNTYGLFRSMTGMGKSERVKDAYGVTRHLTQVARPELSILGSNDNGRTWHEIPFRYKPNPAHPSIGPVAVAPHQPRLDWQMWFAALSPNPPAWFVHLLVKLLEGKLGGEDAEGNELVWDLLDWNTTDAVFSPENPPQFIKVTKHSIDFTRLQGCDGGRNKHTSPSSAHSARLTAPKAWWREVAPETEYIPPVDATNQQIQNFLAQQQWIDVCSKMRRDDIAYRAERQKELLFEEDSGAPYATRTHMFRIEDGVRAWHLQYWLALAEENLPHPRSYAPFARSFKKFVNITKDILHQDWQRMKWTEILMQPVVVTLVASIVVVKAINWLANK